MTTYVMEAKENYDATHVTAIAALTTYVNTNLCTDQNYQGIQWDPVRRNLMYMYVENIPTTPTTNTTGHTLWDGFTAYAPGATLDPSNQFNSSVAVKNIDSGTVTFNLNYNVANIVPNGIGGSDGTYRRATNDFHAISPGQGGNGPGMTDPYTGNFWINSQSCPLYCFRLEDNYALNISPLKPVHNVNNTVPIVGFTNTGATGPWAFGLEVDQSTLDPTSAYLYLVPREFTAEEISADYLLAYATYTYPVVMPASIYRAYNREVFDHAGNMYLFSCVDSGGKAFTLYKFSPPTAADYPTPAVGGGFTDITPWGVSAGPNADGADYILARTDSPFLYLGTPDIVPMYLPATDDLVLIEKFLPNEKEMSSTDPALMFWSCTYVHSPASGPTYDHHSAFVTGYMTADWAPTDIDGAAYAVIDAFETNNYLGQSDYDYSGDITALNYVRRWFFFVCTKMSGGTSDDKPRIVLVEYQFVYGNPPAVVKVIDEQGWDDAYPGHEQTIDVYSPYDAVTAATVASAMTAVFNNDSPIQTRWDNGIYDPLTNSFWWSGGATDSNEITAFFSQFDSAFTDRMQDDSGVPGAGTNFAAIPPFLKLSFADDSGGTTGTPTVAAWGFRLDNHRYYVIPSVGLIYDLETGQWSEWLNESLTRLRANVGQNWAGMTGSLTVYGTDIVAGDDTTGVVWIFDPNIARDDLTTTGNEAFTRVVTSMVAANGRESIPCNAVQLTCALGDPSQTGASITLETSDDLGQTWLNHGSQVVVAGDFTQVVEWRGLGLIREPGRVFRFTDDGATVRFGRAELR